MKCPKYVRNMIERRVRLAVQLTDVDVTLTDWLDGHGILDSLEDYDYCGGVEIYCNPRQSADRIYRAIEEAESR